MRHFSLFVLAVVLMVSTSGCHMFSPTPPKQWEETRLRLTNQQVLFEGLVLALQREGFSVGMGADAAAGEIVTGWRVKSSPFKGRGYRERAFLNFSPTPEGDKSLIRLRVERETNESLRPLVEGSAKWERAPDQVDVASRVLQYAHSYLDPGSVIDKPSDEQ